MALALVMGVAQVVESFAYGSPWGSRTPVRRRAGRRRGPIGRSGPIGGLPWARA